jgi:hypothetical protein
MGMRMPDWEASGSGGGWWHDDTGPYIGKLETLRLRRDDETVDHATQEYRMNQVLKGFLAASVIALGLAGPLTVARTAGAQAAYEAVDQPTDEQLQRYAAAVRKVSAVAAEYQPKLEAAQDEPAKQAVRVEADQKMVDQVEAGGMSVAEYNGISRAVRENPELRQKVERLVGK